MRSKFFAVFHLAAIQAVFGAGLINPRNRHKDQEKAPPTDSNTKKGKKKISSSNELTSNACNHKTVSERLEKNNARLGEWVVNTALNGAQQFGANDGVNSSPKAISRSVLGHEITFLEGYMNSKAGVLAARGLDRGDYHLRELGIPHDGEGFTVLDVGSNVGLTAIMLKKMYPKVHVVGIEPSPATWAAAQWNLKMNNITEGVTIVHAAVSSNGCPLKLYTPRANPGAATVVEEFRESDGSYRQRAGTEEFLIETVTIPELLRHTEVCSSKRPVWFIKLDCEGCEYDAIQDLTEGVREIFQHALVFGEYHSDRLQTLTARRGYLVKRTNAVFTEDPNPGAKHREWDGQKPKPKPPKC